MFKPVNFLFLIVISFSCLAEIEVPESVRNQIISDVMTDQGYYDAAVIEERIRLWQFEQPQPRASGVLTESGACSPTCEQTGGNANLPKPRNVNFKGKVKDGKFTQNLIIKWKRPQNLPVGSNYQLQKYKVILSKDGSTYEKYKIQAKFKNNGKPKKHQKLKLRGLEIGGYTVQVRAVYKDIGSATVAAKSSVSKSLTESSEWSDPKGGESKPDPTTVGELPSSSALKICLLDDVNTPNETVDGNTLLANITHIKCIEQGLVDSDIQLLSLFDGLILLNIKKNDALTNISPLGEISQLSWLNLNWNHSLDLSPLADETKFNSLESLYISWMGLTQIPQFPESVTYISLVGNLISDNGGGYFPDFPLDVIDVSNNKQSLDVNNEPTGDLVLNDQFITNLVNNDFAVKTFKARHTVLTNLSSLAGIDGLENLEIKNANLNSSQNLGNFSGFCSLSINSDQMVKLKKKRPVQFLDLTDNPVLKNADVLRKDRIEDGVYHDYQPLQSNMTGSNALKCEVYYQAEDNTETSLQDMNSVPSFNLPNGEKAQVLNCPILTIPTTLTNAEFCKPNEVSNTVAVYQDLDSSRRFITWEKVSYHDYARWGVTHFKISTYLGPQLLNVHFQTSNEPYLFKDSNMQPDKYVIQACTENVCGYERDFSGAIGQGLTQVNGITQHWNNNNEQVSFKFSYSNSVFTDANGKGAPDYFKITPTFTQPSGTASIPNVDVSIINGQHQYQPIWQSVDINVSQFIGTGYAIQACSNDLGCGVAKSVSLERPQIQTEITVDDLTGTQASMVEGSILLTWDTNNLDEDIDYIKIVETQPQMKDGYKAIIDSIPSSGVQTKNVTYYTDEITKALNIKRVINGDYTFKLSACHRVRDNINGDVCSQSSTVNQRIEKIGPNNYPNTIFPSRVVTGWSWNQSAYWYEYPQAGGSSDLYWFKIQYNHNPNKTKAPDYFHFENLTDRSVQCVQKYKNPEENGDEYLFKQLDSFVIDNDSRTRYGNYQESKSVCMFPSKPGDWAVSACFSGIGCGEAMIVNLSEGTVLPMDLNNDSPVEQIVIEGEDPQNFSAGGSGSIAPGLYWDPQQSGTGWQFHWATHLDGHPDNANQDFRVAYDLVAYWFAYTKKVPKAQDPNQQHLAESNWTPTWFKAKLKRDRDNDYYDGALFSYKKQSDGSYIPSVVGTLNVNLNDADPENYKMEMNIDFDDAALTSYLSDSTFETPCGESNQLGLCELTLENINIKLIDGGTPGNVYIDRFGFGNNNDHYSGVWAHDWDEDNGTADPAIITTINRGLEVSWVATFDDIVVDNQGVQTGGDPFWAVSQSCGEETCEASSGDYFSQFLNIDDNQTDSNIHSIQRGFNPLGFTPSGFWSEDSITPQSVGKLGRCFNNTSYDDGRFYLDLNVNSIDFEGRNVNKSFGDDSSSYDGQPCNQTNGLESLEKIAGNHYIGLEVNEENAVSNIGPLVCDPGKTNGLGTCIISFDWYTNGQFKDLAPFYQKATNGTYLPFTQGGLCRDPISSTPDGHVVKGFSCLIDNNSSANILYNFQLRKKKYTHSSDPNYINPYSWEPIAQSVPLLVLKCSTSGPGCENNVDLIPPTVEMLDPVVTGTMEVLMGHYPEDGPIPGSAGVSGGAATYQIPILIPPGVNGMTPSVSINYSSKGGNGIMGVGWSQSAGSSIYRCTATLAQDGYYKSVTFDDSASGDRLCLDGQKLKVISNVAYWGHLSEYRTEQDSFSKVIYDNTNDRFTVYTKSGRTLVYNSYGDFDWLLQNETDTFGNSIAYSYISAGENEYLLSKITYKGDSNVDSENRYVDFVYEDRVDDYSVSYLHGKKREQTKRIESISTSVDSSIVRIYEINYRNSLSSSNTLLESIDEIAGSTTKTLFNAQWTDEGWDSNPASQVSYKNIRADVLGHFTSGNRPRNITNLKPSLDFNGDGIKDLSYGPENLNQFQNAGIVFLDENSEVLNVLDDFGAKDVNKVGPGDINADGINDLIAYDDETGELKFYQWKIGSDIENDGNVFSNFYEEDDLNLDFGQSMINQFNWGVLNKTCGTDNYKLNFDPEVAEFYIRDYDNDGLDDILVLVQLKEGQFGGVGNDCSWSGVEKYQIKSKLILFKNNSEWPRVGIDSNVSFNPIFNSPTEIMGNLEPKFEHEGEDGGINTYLYDNIKNIEDFNGDGLLDFEVKRLFKSRWDVSETPMIPTLVNHKIYFQTGDGQQPVPRTLEQLGLNGFMCLKIDESQSVACDSANTETTGFGPNSLSFEDINGDGLKDVLYYDHAIMSLDVDGNRIYDRDIQRNWKVRLNKGGSYDSEIFESISIESPLAASGTAVQNFLPQGNICENLSSISDDETRKRMYKTCNFVFRAGVRYADINADGSRELIFPNAGNLALNRCMITGGVVTRGSGQFIGTDFCTTNEDIFEDPDNLGLNGPGKLELCQNMANLNLLESMESSTVNPSYDSRIPEFILSNVDHFFGNQGSSCLNGSCTEPPNDPTPPNFPIDPQFIPETLQGSGGTLAYACSDSTSDKFSLYEDLGGLNALWDRGVYGFSALNFDMGSDGSLEISEINDTGIYSTLFWGGGDDHSGDGISDYYAPVGCMDEPQGYELIGCTNDSGVITASAWENTPPFSNLFNSTNGFDGYESDGHHILMTRDQNEMPDMIKRINVPKTDQWFEWTYSPISDKSRADFPVYSLPERNACVEDSVTAPCLDDGYIEQQGAEGKYFYFNSSMYVVSEMQQNSGIGDIISSNQYAYEEAVYNNQGRGFQGFRKISVRSKPNIASEQNITESISTFNQIFPLAGKLESVEVKYQPVVDDFKSVKRDSYQWYETNQSAHSNEGVYFNPILRVIANTYKDDGISLQSITDDIYTSSQCSDRENAYDDFGNNLCNKKSTFTYLDIESRDGGEKSLLTKTAIETASFYADPEVGTNTTENPWWIDKLISTKVKTTIIEPGTYDKPSGFSYTGLSSTQYNLMFWKSSVDRELECQFTLGVSDNNITSCLFDVSGSQMMKNSFTYDGYGNVTSVNSQGEGFINSATNVIEESARDITTSFATSSGYFANSINNEGLITSFTYDKATGQPTETTDTNGVSTRYEYDDFNFMEEQAIFLDLPGSNEDLLNQPAQMAIQSCFREIDVNVFICEAENTLVDQLMSNMSSKIDLLTTKYHGQFFTNGYNTPLLTYKTQTRQAGSPMVTQWFDQNNQVVLTKTRHSKTSISSQDTYTLSLTNHLGQTEVVTEPFESGVDWGLSDYPYFTFNVYDQKGRQIEKHQELGQLSTTTGTCWRKTEYNHDGLSTEIDASYNGTACHLAQNNLNDMSRSYDASGRLRQTVDVEGSITDYWYDAAGNPYMVVDAMNNVIKTDFDDLGRKTKVVDPNMGTKTFQYNAFGEVVFSQDANQESVGIGNYFMYDQLGRLVEQYSNTGFDLQPITDQVSYKDTFDYPVGRSYISGSFRSSNETVSSSFYTAHATTYEYDDFARVISQSNIITGGYPGFDVEFNIDFHYYENNNSLNNEKYNYLKQTIYTHDRFAGGGYSVVNEYDVFGSLTRQRQNPTADDTSNPNDELMHISEWNHRGQPKSRVLYDNEDMETEYDYYPGTGQLKQIINNNVGVNQQFNYQYDAWGNIATQKLANASYPSGITETFIYDQLHRLDSSEVDNLDLIDYNYDVLGNLIKKSDYADTQNYGFGTGPLKLLPNAIASSVTPNGTKNYYYDDVGNRSSDVLNSLTNTYEYDANNLMTYSHQQSGDQSVLFRYGADNQRYLRIEESNDQASQRTIEATFYAGSNFELVRNDATDETESKFHVTDYLTVTRKNNLLLERHFLQKDRLGSTTQILDKDGVSIATKGYDAFGKPRDGDSWQQMENLNPSQDPALNFERSDASSTLTTDITKRGFTGHEHLDNFELIHMNGRMYDFNNGRFLSVDSFIQGTTSQAINPYSYIQNNPLSGVDPTGYIMECEGLECPWDDSMPGGPLPGSQDWWLKRVSLNSNGSGDSESKHDTGDNSDLNEQADVFLQDWNKRSINDMFEDGTFAEPDPDGFRAYYPPPLLFNWLGDPIAGWRDDRTNPITGVVLSEAEAFDARFFSIIDIGTMGLGSKAATTGKVADDVVTSLADEIPTVAYNRQLHYGGSQTSSPAARAARSAGENTACPTCNQTQITGTRTAPSPQHEPTLVQHYYEHGGHAMTDAQRRAYAKKEGIDGTQCITCQRQEGAAMARYSKEQKAKYGLK